MTQVILTRTADGRWCYAVLTDGLVTAADTGYDLAADALGDALDSPTPV